MTTPVQPSPLKLDDASGTTITISPANQMTTAPQHLIDSIEQALLDCDKYYHTYLGSANTEQEYKKIQKAHIKERSHYVLKLAVYRGETPDPKTYKKPTKKNPTMRDGWANATAKAR